MYSWITIMITKQNGEKYEVNQKQKLSQKVWYLSKASN